MEKFCIIFYCLLFSMQVFQGQTDMVQNCGENEYSIMLTPLTREVGIQFTTEKFEIDGYVMSNHTRLPVENVWVHNKSSHLLVNTNKAGAFTIPVRLNDTLIFSSINFFQDTFIVTQYPGGFIKIFLQPRVYQIGEVEIKRWKDYESFKQEFMALNTNKQPDYSWIPNQYSDKIPEYENPESFKNPLFYLANPISALYYRFNKLEQSKRKLHELELKDKNKELYEHKYNTELVYALTGLEGYALNRFMIFCDFKDGFLLKSSEMEIIEAIQEKFEQYKDMVIEEGEIN